MGTLYMVGNTHFDPVWLWTWDEAMASIRATFRSALDRMREDGAFCYSFSSPPVFEWIRKTDPGMFEEIRGRVKEGRWELAEGWWNQPDLWAASGESYVRQGLYGQRYLQKTFGMRAVSITNVDSFGHSAMLPQILSKAGIRYYCFCRPEEKHVPLRSPSFLWRSPDGSTVEAFRIGGGAGGAWAYDTAEAMQTAKESEGDMLLFYGVTDHGGAPTKKSIGQIHADTDAVFSTVRRFFECRKPAPDMVWQGELMTGDFGVFCNGAEVKKNNRRAEYLLLNAEKASRIAGRPHREELTRAWEDVMFNQFHDILGGSSIREAYTDARNLHGRAMQTAGELLHTDLQYVTANIRTPGKNPDNVWNLVLWNLNGEPYCGYVEAEVQWVHEFPWYRGGIALEDAEGNRIPCQVIRERSVIPAFRSRFLFPATVPAGGYRCLRVCQTQESVPPVDRTVPSVFRVGRYEVSLSAGHGGICSVAECGSGRVVARDLFLPVCYADPGDTWSFNAGYGEKLGMFRISSLWRSEEGTHATVIRMRGRWQDSLLQLTYTFYHDASYFDLEYRVNWNEAHTVFKLECATEAKTVTVASPYLPVERGESASDRPMGEWIRAGQMLLLCDGMFAYRLNDGVLGLTVLRSPVYGDLRISEEEPSPDCPVMEEGITEGKLRIFPEYCGSNPQAEATAFANPPVVVCESNHDGTLPPSGSYFSLDGSAAVSLTAVKYGEDSGTVFRLVNGEGSAQDAVLRAEGKSCPVRLAPYEIRTLKQTEEGAFLSVNLLEEPEEKEK